MESLSRAIMHIHIITIQRMNCLNVKDTNLENNYYSICCMKNHKIYYIDNFGSLPAQLRERLGMVPIIIVWGRGRTNGPYGGTTHWPGT
ncbi:hypothetical protein XENTR_v10009100 [Xenopus tropicalis]|nr:hypothetical protein XENTR_v10009100 [Xenopus tropicalis]